MAGGGEARRRAHAHAHATRTHAHAHACLATHARAQRAGAALPPSGVVVFRRRRTVWVVSRRVSYVCRGVAGCRFVVLPRRSRVGLGRARGRRRGQAGPCGFVVGWPGIVGSGGKGRRRGAKLRKRWHARTKIPTLDPPEGMRDRGIPLPLAAGPTAALSYRLCPALAAGASASALGDLL